MRGIIRGITRARRLPSADAYWDRVDQPVDRDYSEWARQQIARDEDEAYARNAAIDRQEAEIAARTQGAGPGYEYEEVDPDQEYLDWCADEMFGDERGNPPDSVLLDLQLDHYAERFPENRAEAAPMYRDADGDWTFEDWAEAAGYSEIDIEVTGQIEATREERLAQAEGRQIVSEIGAVAADPQYADVKDQIEDMGDYVRRVMGLTEREPGQL